jgi:hypothetical protein
MSGVVHTLFIIVFGLSAAGAVFLGSVLGLFPLIHEEDGSSNNRVHDEFI